ncbi:MAG: hypothetical protein EOP48_01735 [Sphingobacteriales bacterium]|nr:MAG: hypothetical protein EOP48_01735 [Sphingobacteriales bacterium]
MSFHSVRQKVQKGKKIYGSKIGANGYLHVDPDKHIVMKGVVIGGITKDDLVESNLRHRYEKKIANLQIESWDSWLRKSKE